MLRQTLFKCCSNFGDLKKKIKLYNLHFYTDLKPDKEEKMCLMDIFLKVKHREFTFT